MKTKLHILILCFFTVNLFAQWEQVGDALSGTIENQQFGYRTAMSGDGNTIIVGSRPYDASGYKNLIEVFKRNNNAWSRVFFKEDFNDDTENSIDPYHVEMSRDGKVFAFSSTNQDATKITVYKEGVNNTYFGLGNVFVRTHNNTDNVNTVGLNKISLNKDGTTLAFSGGFRDDNDDTLHRFVKIYKLTDTNWIQKGTSLADGEQYYSHHTHDVSGFGNDIDLSDDGNTLIVGEHRYIIGTAYTGRVSVYNFTNNQWSLLGSKIEGRQNIGERFGGSVSISGNGEIIAMSTNYSSSGDFGYTKVYKLENNNWTQIGNNLKVRGGVANGSSEVSLNGYGNIIGIYNKFHKTSAVNNPGALAFYQFKNGQWLQKGENLEGPGNGISVYHSFSTISTDGKKTLFYNYVDDTTETNAGIVKVYKNNNVNTSTITYVPDDNFEQALIDLGRDTVLDNFVNKGNISSLTSLNLENKNIADLTGIEDFTALENINISRNSLSNLNITKNVNLKYLYVSNNNLTSLDVSKNTKLLQLDFADNNINTIDLSFNSKLQSITASRNQMTGIDVTKQKDLDWLILNENFITEIDISFNPSLRTINIKDNRLTKFELKNNTTIESINTNNNYLENINIAGATNLKTLKVESNQLSSLDLSTNTSLENLFAKNNSLECVQVADVNYANVNWSSHTDAGVSFSTDCADVWTIKVDPTILTTLMQIQGLDANNDGNITLAEAAAFIGELDLSNSGITLVDGLQAFTKITTLNLSGNGISDLSPLTGLTIELLSKNSNTTKTVSTTPLALENLIISNNSFQTLNLESLVNLKTVDISNNQDLVTLSIKNGKNETITSFISTGTPNLTCILVDNKNAAYLSNWNIDNSNSFANSITDCRQNVLSVDNVLLKSLKIYPNPVRNILTIKLSNQVEYKKATITNLTGKVVLKSNEKSINVHQLSKGMYLLKIDTNKGTIIKKIVKF